MEIVQQPYNGHEERGIGLRDNTQVYLLMPFWMKRTEQCWTSLSQQVYQKDKNRFPSFTL